MGLHLVVVVTLDEVFGLCLRGKENRRGGALILPKSYGLITEESIESEGMNGGRKQKKGRVQEQALMTVLMRACFVEWRGHSRNGKTCCISCFAFCWDQIPIKKKMK